MSVLLYTGEPGDLGELLREMIKTDLPGREIVALTTFEELSWRLHQRRYDVDAVVLLLSTREELEAMLSQKGSLWGLRVIVVLADQDRETISKAYRLSPRFIGFTEDGLNDVTAVLAKMVEGSRALETW